MKGSNHIPWLLGLMVLFTAMRWPGLLPSNFSPVYAICFCAGLYLSGWRAWAVPLGLLFVSDVVMNYFVYRPMGYSVFSASMIGLYALYLLLIAMGWRLGKNNRRPLDRRRNSGCVRVFLWKQHTGLAGRSDIREAVAGWVQSFTVGKAGFPPAIMFFRNSAVSGALFTTVIVCRAVYPFC